MRANLLQRLTASDRRALDALVARLAEKYPGKIAQVILFGSRARGDASGESDFDLLIVTKDGIRQLEETLAAEVEPAGAKHRRVFSPHVISEEEFASKRTREPFYRSIASEGIDLFGKSPRRLSRGRPLVYRPPNRGFRMDENTRIQIRLRLERSRQYMAEARALYGARMLPGAISRAYYAVFTLTMAVLLTLDLVRTKHSGVADAFSEYFIKEGRLEEQYKDIFLRVRKERELADYRFKDYTEAEADAVLADCDRFIARMEKYLHDVGAISSEQPK